MKQIGMVRVNVQCVNDTGDITQDRKQDVDEEVCIATSLKEDTKRRENDGKDDLADVSTGALSAVRTYCAEGHGRFGATTYDAVKGMLRVVWCLMN